MFADDTKIYKRIYDNEDHISMQEDINRMLEWSEKWLLKFHPGKCHVVEISNTRVKNKFEYKMENTVLEHVDEEKDLGVTIDNQLDFEQHITNKVKTANKVMGTIRRMYKHLNESNFKKLYVGLVRPHLEYAQSVWSPGKKSQVDKLEEVQRRATKQIPGLSNMSYEDRLRKLKLPSLVYRRLRGDMIEMYKLLSPNNLYDPRITDFIKKKEHQVTTNMVLRSQNSQITEPTGKKRIRENYFTCRSQLLWNNLDKTIVGAPNVNIFKNRLDKHWRNQDFLYNYESPMNRLQTSNLPE